MERESVERFLGDVVKTVKDGFDKVVQKTDQLTHMGRLKVDILAIKRDIDKLLAALGRRVYTLKVEGKQAEIAEDAEVTELVQKVEKLEERLALKKDELEHLSRAQAEAEAAQPDSAPGGENEPEAAEADAVPAATAEEAAAGLESESDDAADAGKKAKK